MQALHNHLLQVNQVWFLSLAILMNVLIIDETRARPSIVRMRLSWETYARRWRSPLLELGAICTVASIQYLRRSMIASHPETSVSRKSDGHYAVCLRARSIRLTADTEA
jgi:hypothetical protein